jgi:heptosyltransferase-3
LKNLSETKPLLNRQTIRRVLIVRLRSIGDTVLATPSLYALRRFLPDAQIDILLEDWVAPVLDGFDAVDNVLTVKENSIFDRLRVMSKLARTNYDAAYNLHGGTTAGFFVLASRAKYRIGFQTYQNHFCYTHLAPSAAEFWNQSATHSAEQQLALLGWTGVFVRDKLKSRLIVKPELENFHIEIYKKYEIPVGYEFALIHPTAAFDTKTWAVENFARAVDFLYERGIVSIAVGTKNDLPILLDLFNQSNLMVFLHDCSLPEITALASKARIFVGNDSGIAHVAAAVNAPSVVVFGSSNVIHWRPWTSAPNEVVSENLPCAPCAGYRCEQFDQPECIRQVAPETVTAAIERILSASKKYF